MLNTPLTRNAFVLEGGGLLNFFGDEKSLMCGHIPYSVILFFFGGHGSVSGVHMSNIFGGV